MAAISELLPRHFSKSHCVVGELDIGIFHAGKMAQMIYDLVIYPDGEINADSVAAAAQSLLALLGQLGPLVDHLEATAVVAMPKAG